MSPTPHTGPFNLEQTGIDVQLVPTLTSPYALGLWLAEQPARTQALMLAGWLQGLEEPQATAMLRMVNVGRELRELAAPLSGATAALEHLLHSVRGIPTIDLDGRPWSPYIPPDATVIKTMDGTVLRVIPAEPSDDDPGVGDNA